MFNILSLFSKDKRHLAKLRQWAIDVHTIYAQHRLANIMKKDLQQAIQKYLHKRKQLEPLVRQKTDYAYIMCAVQHLYGITYHDEQLMGAFVLQDGQIAEMKTGEGKTITAALAVISRALNGEMCYVLTTNDYLSKRDRDELAPLYQLFNLEVAFNESETTKYKPNKQVIHRCPVVYSSHSELCFDYLRNQLAISREDVVLDTRPDTKRFDFVVIDEADSILIDEAKEPIILSRPRVTDTEFLKHAKKIADNVLVRSDVDETVYANMIVELETLASLSREDIERLDKVKGDFYFDAEKLSIHLFESAFSKIEQYLLERGLIKNVKELYNDKLDYMKAIESAIRAKYGVKRDEDYLIDDGEVKIINRNNGRIKDGSRWVDGLHQAVEFREGVAVKDEHEILGRITYGNFFKLFKTVSGMTGTAYTERAELHDVYGLNTVVIPTHAPVVRKDMKDKMFLTKEVKYKHLVKFVRERHNKGQPILIGTPEVLVSEEVAKVLDKAKIPYELLNAKPERVKREAEIIAKAGQPYAVTISTNMAGRGTDIKLNFNACADEEMRGMLKECGLCVIGVEKNYFRRIDNQLRGRSGRQGDNGESVFFVSLEDGMLVKSAKPEMLVRARNMFAKSPMAEEELDIKLSSWDKTLSETQMRIESLFADYRKNTRALDDVLFEQRKVIDSWRTRILYHRPDVEVEHVLNAYVAARANEFLAGGNEYTLSEVWQAVCSGLSVTQEPIEHGDAVFDAFDVEKYIPTMQTQLKQMYSAMWDNLYAQFDILSEKDKEKYERTALLEVIDRLWIDHLSALELVYRGSELSVMANKNPIFEFRQRAFDAFKSLHELYNQSAAEKVINGLQYVIQAHQEQVADDEDAEEEADLTSV